MNFVIRLIVNAVAIFVAVRLVPGITIRAEDYLVTLLGVALIFGIVNAIIKPILAAMTCPLYVLTLGLFTFVVNALMLLLTSGIADALKLGFHVADFPAALFGSIIISIVSFVLSLFISDNRNRHW